MGGRSVFDEDREKQRLLHELGLADAPGPANMKYRFENFGGIISSDAPPFLAFVDRQFMRELGLEGDAAWQDSDESMGLLSAPTEVHFAITNACPMQCAHCYMGAGERDEGELDTAALKEALRALAEWGVFHVALGGGEALARDDLFEVAEYVRSVGMVPNLTISGALLDEEKARHMAVFGQVNVSMDGVEEHAAVFRGTNTFAQADRAIGLLAEAGVSVGINCVVGRRNFDHLRDLFAYARRKKVNEVECLRLKPSGRGGPSYEDERTTFDQNTRLIPLLAHLAERTGVSAKIDCSFVPMLCWHEPPRDMLEAMATYGCEAGNVLLGARSNGMMSGCSFLKSDGLTVADVQDVWRSHKGFEALRTWPSRAPEPCASCTYLDLCKGGCHAVSEYVTGDVNAPDPDCPKVVEYREQKTENR